MIDQIISHNGVVQSIEGEHVRVRILQSSACSGCAAKQMCSSAEAKEKEVDVLTHNAPRFKVGQEVVLDGHLSDGRYAAMIAYGLPLALLIPVLFVVIQLTGSDIQGALWALGTVAVYYVVIFLFFRNHLQRRFSFRIREKS